MVDVIEDFRKKGFSTINSIINGILKRFKSVWLTTTTTVLGVVPVAFGESKLMGIPYASLGVVILYGMLISTIINLILLPLLYLFFSRLESTIKRKIGLQD